MSGLKNDVNLSFGAILAMLVFTFCSNAEKQNDNKYNPATLINQARTAHGSSLVDSSTIAFDFRGRHYVSQRSGGRFQYERQWTDTTGTAYRDVLTNDGLYREINGERVPLSAKDSAAYAGSVNSVLYFALLPYYLNDPAVQTEYLGTAVINEAPYHKVKVTFRAEGGGEDYQDEYIYWFHRDRHTMDYLAYNYQVDGGGARFREAYNIRNVDGLRIDDYRNYKPVTHSMEVAVFDSLFEAGQMEQVSLIETENLTLSR
mgnify:FL=1